MKQISESFVQYIIDQCKMIQQIPSPTFQEQEVAAYIAKKFGEINDMDTAITSTGNVITKIQGIKSTKPVIISAHMDTVHPQGTDLKITTSADRITGPSIGDNSLGVAGLLTILYYFQELKITPAQDIWLVANTCEEGLGNLEGMINVVDMFKRKPMAYIILEGIGLGRTIVQGLSVERYRVRFAGAGGHSWGDFGKPSAIHEMTHVIEQILALPIPQTCKTTINIGKVSGGTSINTIAPWAEFEIDLRSEHTTVLMEYRDAIFKTMTQNETDDMKITWDEIGKRPGGFIKPGHPLVQKAKEAYKAYGIEANLTSGSTDANIPLAQGLPAISISLTHGDHTHSLDEYIELQPISEGLSVLIHLLNLLWVKPKPSRRPPSRNRH